MKKLNAGGGWQAIRYTFKKGIIVRRFVEDVSSSSVSKRMGAQMHLGMGGQHGGMVNEHGSFPEVCKKSIQAMAADMQPAITADFWAKHPIRQMKFYSPHQMETSGRLIQPILYERGTESYRTITWVEAFDRIAAQLKAITPDESFWYFSGRSSNEAGFLLQLLARLYGTNNVNNCSYYCHETCKIRL